jgi:Htaa
LTTRKVALALAAGAITLSAAVPAAAPAAGWTAAAALPGGAAADAAALARGLDGGVTALWLQAGRGLQAAQRPLGGDWSAPQRISRAGEAAFQPDVAAGPEGVATAVWLERRTGTGGTDVNEVLTASRSASGTWSQPALLSADGAPVAATVAPRVVVDANGTATAAWPESCAVMVATRPARGSWSAPQEIFRDTTGGCALYAVQTPIALAADRDGAVTALWRSGYRLASQPKSVKSAVRPAGAASPWRTARDVVTGVAGIGEPQLAVDADGRAVASWGVADGGARAAARPAGLDEPWQAPQSLSGSGTPVPRAAYDGHGGATVAWEEGADVRVATLDAAGSWGAAETAATVAGATPAAPRIALDDDGGALLLWARADGSAVEAVHRPAGGAWSAVATLAQGAAGAAAAPALAGDALGGATALWGGSAPAVADHAVAAPLRTDWSGRSDGASTSLRSWVDYLHRTWGSVIPGVPSGPGTVELSDGASWPRAEDRYSFRFGQADAWRDTATGETVVRLQGTLRFSLPAHAIDVRLVQPLLRIAPDGGRARLVSDGFTSGAMEDAMAGRTSLQPFEGVTVLDVDLAAGGPRPANGGERRSWIAAPATFTEEAGSAFGLGNYAGMRWGTLTFTLPATVPDRAPVDEAPVERPQERAPVQEPPAERPPASKPVSARLTAVKPARLGRGRTTATIARIACPASAKAACRVTAPARVRVTVAGRRWRATVLAPRSVRPGRRATVRVRLPRPAVSALAGRRARLSLKLVVRSGGARAAKTLAVTLQGAAKRRAGAGR